MPDLCEAKFSLTMIVVENTWLYCFGGVGDYGPAHQGSQVVERLNTAVLREEDHFSEHNKALCSWERVELRSKYETCCQQGVIPLKSLPGSNERRYLVFGGVHGDYNRNTFIVHEDLLDFSKSRVRELTAEQQQMQLAERDKFYYQQSFKIDSLPEDVWPGKKGGGANATSRMKAPSENLVVYPGRRALHVFDIDREHWVTSSTKGGHQYEDIYHQARQRSRASQQAQAAAESDTDGAVDGSDEESDAEAMEFYDDDEDEESYASYDDEEDDNGSDSSGESQRVLIEEPEESQTVASAVAQLQQGWNRQDFLSNLKQHCNTENILKTQISNLRAQLDKLMVGAQVDKMVAAWEDEDGGIDSDEEEHDREKHKDSSEG